MDEHRAVASLLEGAEPIDIEGYTQLAYATKRFFSANRWGLVGDAAAFADPFYSPGSDFIAMECDFLADLIRREAAGEERSALEDRTETYDAFMRFRWEATMRVYRGLYSTFGSYELMRIKFNFDFGCYYNLWYDAVALDKHLDLRFLKSELRKRPDTLAATSRFAELFQRVETDLRERGAYHRGNLGEYNVGVDCVRPLIEEAGTPRKKRQIDRRTEDIFNYARDESLKLLGLDDVEPKGPLRLYQFADPAVLG